jgi:hypothetical protein
MSCPRSDIVGAEVQNWHGERPINILILSQSGHAVN